MRVLISGAIGFAIGIVAVLLLKDERAGRSERLPSNEIERLRATIREEQEKKRRYDAQIRQAEAELEARRARVSVLPAVVEAAEGAKGGASAARDHPAVAEEAAALGVPNDALLAAFDAYADPSQENLDRLARHGADGFRALVAMLRGGLSGPRFQALFERCWTSAALGEERALIETVDTQAVHVWSRWTALRSLGIADTPTARDYVVARLRAETDGGLFMCAAEAAGRLKEGRALPEILRGMRNRDWSEGVRSEIFDAAVHVAGDRARDVMIDYLREPTADLLGTGLFHLESIDRKAARREAAALLAGPRADSLTVYQLADVRHYAGQR